MPLVMGDLVVSVSLFVDSLSYFSLTTADPTPTPLPSLPTIVPSDEAAAAQSGADSESLWNKIVTGPPMAGFFTFLAAIVAFAGIKMTIEQNKKATEALGTQHAASLAAAKSLHEAQQADAQARHKAELDAANQRHGEQTAQTTHKADSDRWWATLMWAYEKAQESQDKKNENAFRKVAVVAILKSLNRNKERLNLLQKDAVASIASIFEDAEEPDVRASVIELYESMGKPSPYAERDFLGKKVGDALRQVPLVYATFADVRTPGLGGRHLHDWVVEMTDGRLVIVECTKASSSLPGLRPLSRTIGRDWPEDAAVPPRLRGQEVAGALLVYAGMRGIGSKSQRFEVNDLKGVGALQWSPDFPDSGLVEQLTAFFSDLRPPHSTM